VQRFLSRLSPKVAPVAWACLLAAHTASSATAVTFRTSDARLASAFDWARKQALAYTFKGDPVGLWYEAALPGRQAFCMRDTAHQSMGAHFLGLEPYTRNMLRKFAENISESKDWCSYWEINRDNVPAPADYKDDAQFWYNLPANFDVLDASYRMYVWSGDSSYLIDPVFQNFYRRTVHDYVERWDLSLERIMMRPRIMNIRGHLDPANRFQRNRGIPSYDEANPDFVVAIDQLAAQYAGYLAYSRLARLRADTSEANEFLRRAIAVKAFVNEIWWDKKSGTYYSRVNLDHRLEGNGLTISLLYYEVAQDGEKSAAVLKSILEAIQHKERMGVEGQSHLPEILYRYGKAEAAYQQILDLTREDKERREYPEVSYSVVGAIVNGLMGIEVESPEPGKAFQDAQYVEGPVVTTPRLTSQTEWAEVGQVPVRANQINVRHEGLRRSTLQNTTGPSLVWKACFPGSFATLIVDGKAVQAKSAGKHGEVLSCATIDVGSGDTRTVYTRR
jgi:tetratricopeptide (TPR) repeat protein